MKEKHKNPTFVYKIATRQGLLNTDKSLVRDVCNRNNGTSLVMQSNHTYFTTVYVNACSEITNSGNLFFFNLPLPLGGRCQHFTNTRVLPTMFFAFATDVNAEGLREKHIGSDTFQVTYFVAEGNRYSAASFMRKRLPPNTESSLKRPKEGQLSVRYPTA